MEHITAKHDFMEEDDINITFHMTRTGYIILQNTAQQSLYLCSSTDRNPKPLRLLLNDPSVASPY